jgi:hypothetical protein
VLGARLVRALELAQAVLQAAQLAQVPEQAVVVEAPHVVPGPVLGEAVA